MLKICSSLATWKSIETQITMAACQLQQLRYRNKGKHKRLKTPSTPKEKAKIVGGKKDVLPEKPTSKRYDEKWMAQVCKNNVVLHQFYPKPTHSLEEILTMHRELLDPTMLNCTDAILHADIEISLKTKKKTKFSKNIRSVISLPHDINHDMEHNIIYMCETKEEKDIALNCGALFVGGEDIVDQIRGKQIQETDYDIILSTKEMIPLLYNIRNLIPKALFPRAVDGTVGDDIESMMNYFKKGILYNSKFTSVMTSRLHAPFARLDMPNEQIYENLKVLFDDVVNHKTGQSNTQYITMLKIMAPPSSEKFELTLGTEEFKEKSKKKGKQAKVEEEEEEEEETETPLKIEQEA